MNSPVLEINQRRGRTSQKNINHRFVDKEIEACVVSGPVEHGARARSFRPLLKICIDNISMPFLGIR